MQKYMWRIQIKKGDFLGLQLSPDFDFEVITDEKSILQAVRIAKNRFDEKFIDSVEFVKVVYSN